MQETLSEEQSISDAEKWLQFLYEDIKDGFLNIWTLDGNTSSWFAVSDLRAAAERAVSISLQGHEVYYMTGLAREALSEREKGAEKDIIALPCLHVDIDLKADAHKAKGLPEDAETALDALNSVGLPEPTVIVSSGYGLHVYWLFESPVRMDTEEQQQQKQQAKKLLVEWQQAFRNVWKAKGWKLDVTHNLDRLLRIPGTYNHKRGGKRLVKPFGGASGQKYTPEALREALESLPVPQEVTEIDFDNLPVPSTPQMTRMDTGARAAPVISDEWSLDLSDSDLLQKAREAKDGEKFTRLFDKGDSADFKSESEADQALLCLLAYWTGRDRMRMQRLFLTSALGNRPKVRNRQDYLDRSIDEACRTVRNVYKPEDYVKRQAVGSPVLSVRLETMPTSSMTLADIFRERYGDDLRYVKEWRAWIRWNGQRWESDEGAHSVRKIAQNFLRHDMERMCQHIADDDKRKRCYAWVVKSQSDSGINGMLSLAADHLSITASMLDSNPMLLNVENGTIDLRTGERREQRKEDLLTKLAPVEYKPDADCPTFKAFVSRIFQNEAGTDQPDVESYVQRALGHSLTGDTSAQAMFLLYGGGCNGKTTLLNAVKAVLGEGEYAMSARSEMLMVDRNRDNKEGEVHLFGKRFVASSETEAGSRFNESLVKRLVDNQTIRARKLYAGEFEFRPTHTLFLDCNHLPRITGDDFSIWRRVKVIPFLQQIMPEERDRHMGERLAAEKSGILKWLLEGLRQYQVNGLAEPSEITGAIEEYRNQNDDVGLFLAECTEEGMDFYVSSEGLFKAYQRWAERNGIRNVMHNKGFSKKIKERTDTLGRPRFSACQRRLYGETPVRAWKGLQLVVSAVNDTGSLSTLEWADI